MTTTEYSHPTLDVDSDGQRIAPYAPDRIELDVERVNDLLVRFGIPLLTVESDGTVYLDSARKIRYRRVVQPPSWGTMVPTVEAWERMKVTRFGC